MAQCNVTHCASQIKFNTRVQQVCFCALFFHNHHVYPERPGVMAVKQGSHDSCYVANCAFEQFHGDVS